MSRLASRDAAQRPARTVSPESRMESHQKVHVWPRPASWTERAACVGHDPEMWDATAKPGRGDSPEDIAAPALAICARCPVTRECRELGDSLPTHTTFRLVFGGHLYGAAQWGVRIKPRDPCAGTCGRLLRPQGVKKSDCPDTVIHHAGGYCVACHGKQDR